MRGAVAGEEEVVGEIGILRNGAGEGVQEDVEAFLRDVAADGEEIGMRMLVRDDVGKIGEANAIGDHRTAEAEGLAEERFGFGEGVSGAGGEGVGGGESIFVVAAGEIAALVDLRGVHGEFALQGDDQRHLERAGGVRCVKGIARDALDMKQVDRVLTQDGEKLAADGMGRGGIGGNGFERADGGAEGEAIKRQAFEGFFFGQIARPAVGEDDDVVIFFAQGVGELAGEFFDSAEGGVEGAGEKGDVHLRGASGQRLVVRGEF